MGAYVGVTTQNCIYTRLRGRLALNKESNDGRNQAMKSMKVAKSLFILWIWVPTQLQGEMLSHCSGFWGSNPLNGYNMLQYVTTWNLTES